MAADFVARDRELASAQEATFEQLANHRWHWTLDESNLNRLSIREYARRVGVGESTVRRMVNGYVEWTAAASGRTPGGPVSLADYVERAKLGVETVEATEAIAAATGKTFSQAAKDRTEVREVITTARDRAERKGTSIGDEVKEVAEWRARGRKARQTERDERQARRFTLVEFEGHIGAAIRRLKEALKLATEADFDSEETEVLEASIEKLKTLVALIDIKVTGENTTIDWDEEFRTVMDS